MARTYKLIDSDDQDDTLIAFYVAQERDHAAHTLNLVRFETILADASITPEFRARVTQLKAETESRLNEVTAILNASEPTLPVQGRLTAAKARLKAKGLI